MSDSSRLPPRPSLEQLRKQAKERLRLLREGDPAARLAHAQLALAREYGFESWPKLVRHVEEVQSTGRIDQFDRLAKDFLAAYAGDAGALERIGAYFGTSYSADTLREKVRDRLSAMYATGEPTEATVQLMIARQYGFHSWAELVAGLSQPPEARADSRLGLSSAPPFYRIDTASETIEPRPPISDGDWDTIFAIMKERGVTGINAAAITDRAMERLAHLDFVTHVHLDGARYLTDDGLLQLAQMPQLEELDVSGYHSAITDRGLEVLRHLKNLRTFKMCWPQRVTDAGAANLTFCDHLERVNLMGTPTGNGAINALTGKRKLRHFNTGRLVTDAGLALLQHFPVFKSWQGGEIEYGLMSFEAEPNNLLLDGPITNQGLASLLGLDGVFALNFFWHVSALTPEALKILTELPNLGFLGCEGKLCTDEAMRHIAAIPRLRMIMAQGTVASDDGFVALSRSPTIEYIWGRECPNLTGHGFEALAAMPALRGLAVSCKNVDDAALSSLPHFPALTGLMPMDVSDQGFRHVGSCEQLENLWCMYCRDTGDIATGHIAGLSRLKTYYAGKTRITDRSLEILGRMQSLERLEFWQCAGITDRGLAFLTGLPRLREIILDDCPGVTRKGATAFPASVRVKYS